MADFETCYNFMMDNEDAARLHATVPDAPPGAHAISGINSAAWPVQFAAISAIPQSERGPSVEAFYKNEFWNQWLEDLTSNDVAMRVLDAAVNAGPGVGVRLLQEAVNDVGPGTVLGEDGAWGPNTVSAANATDTSALITAFKSARLFKYEAIVHGNPALGVYLGTEQNPGPWLLRATR